VSGFSAGSYRLRIERPLPEWEVRASPWDRDRFIGLSQAKSYFAHLCATGKHLFIGIAENKVAVESLKKELEFTVPVDDQVLAWDADKKAEVAALVEFFETNPERAKYMSCLAPTDGR
jgi:hypothetical protein